MRSGKPLPTPGTSAIRFDGVYERPLHGRPSEARTHLGRFLTDGRMVSGNFGTIGTSNIRVADIDYEHAAQYLAEATEPIVVQISGGRVSSGAPLAAGITGWVDAEGDHLLLKTLTPHNGKLWRSAGFVSSCQSPA